MLPFLHKPRSQCLHIRLRKGSERVRDGWWVGEVTDSLVVIGLTWVLVRALIARRAVTL